MRSLIESYKILFSFLFFMSVIGAVVALVAGGLYGLCLICQGIEETYGPVLAAMTFFVVGIHLFVLPLFVYVNKEA